jgi:plasmid maintenance system antidote protein VapI
MKNPDSLETRINAIAQSPTHDWRAVAKQYERELLWIDRSARIAGLVLHRLDKIGMNQKTLAQRMEVSPQYVSKIVKGHENLTLETIAKLEKALGVKLLMVMDKESSAALEVDRSVLVASPVESYGSASSKT